LINKDVQERKETRMRDEKGRILAMKVKLSLTVMISALIVMSALVGNAQQTTPTTEFVFQRPPEARFSVSPQIGPAPLIVSFTNQSRYYTKIKWTLWDVVVDKTQFNDTDENIVYQYLFPGTFPVYLSASSTTGNNVQVQYVTVLPSELPSEGVVVFAGAPRAATAGSTVNFINLTPQNGTKFLWDFGDGTSSTEEDISHVYSNPGLYTVSLTIQFDATLSFVSSTETKVNYINITPAGSTSRLHPEFVGTPVTGTAPQEVQFRASSAGTGKSILWDFGDGGTSGEMNPKHVYNAPGVYTVKLLIDGVESSRADYINTLPFGQDQRSPAAVVLNDDTVQLAILQSLQDKVLNQTLAGLGLLELYSKHSLEITAILLRDDSLRQESGNLVRELLPGFQALVDGGSMTITSSQVESIKSLLGRVASQATPDLSEFLTQVIRDLTTGKILKSIGITVAPN
jgi:PKD repeat protein